MTQNQKAPKKSEKQFKKRSTNKKSIIKVFTSEYLQKILKEINKLKIIAVDTEFDPTYRYIDRVCLIQLGTQKNIYLIDPLAPKLDAQLLKPVFENPDIIKVFHDAQHDVLLLKKALDIHPRSIFDTSVAARVLGIPQPSLKTLIEKYLHKKITKQQSRAEWSQRPLTGEMVHYAANDVRYLVELYKILHFELTEINTLEEATELFELIETTEPEKLEFNPDSFLTLSREKEFTPLELAVLKALYVWRETKAIKQFEDANFIFPTSAVLKLTKKSPSNISELEKTLVDYPNRKTMIQQHGIELLRVIQQGKKAKPIDVSQITITRKFIKLTNTDSDMQVEPRYKRRLSHLRKLNSLLAAERGIEPSLVIPKVVQHQLSQENPVNLDEIYPRPGFGKWRKTQYGEAIIETLHAANSEELCPLCSEAFDEKMMVVRCPHCSTRFHLQEIINMLEKSSVCPKCQEEIHGINF